MRRFTPLPRVEHCMLVPRVRCGVWRGGAENSGKAGLAGRNHYGKHIFGSVFFLASSLSIPVFPVCVKWRSLCHKLLPLFCHTLKCEVTAANLNVLGRSNGSSNTTAGWWPSSPCGTTTGRWQAQKLWAQMACWQFLKQQQIPVLTG